MGPSFNSDQLDRLMEAQDLDVLIVTSKHNVQYLLGGYRFFFFDYMDAIGLSRYLPVLIYPRAQPDKAAYFGNAMEGMRDGDDDQWPHHAFAEHWGSRDTIATVIQYLQDAKLPSQNIGIEAGFLPADAMQSLTDAFPNSVFSDCVVTLEQMRAVKTPEEIDYLRRASEGVVASMIAVMETHGPGSKKRDLVEALRREETDRGLVFEYCLCTLGDSHERAPSDQVWQEGEIISIDSGCNFRGYIGDLCRMGILGEPDAELVDLLGEVETIQQAARHKLSPGTLGTEVIEAGKAALAQSPNRAVTSFVAHGMGLVSHEAPRLTAAGPVPYPAPHAELPLEAGMVTSVETTMLHPSRGFIKLEDTVIVTANGHEGLGDDGRGWTKCGVRA